MSQKNETAVLFLTLLITAGLIGAGVWWFTRRSGINIPDAVQQGQNTPGNLQGFNTVQNVPSGLFNYGGSTSWAPIRLSVDSAIQAARPEFRLRYVDPVGIAPSSSTGIKMLLDGQLDLAQSSRPILDQEYNQAQQRGFALKQIPIAIDGLAVAVNPNLDIPGLTIDQLKSIYSGKITNWQQLGGPNLTIKPFSRPANSGGTVELFLENVMQGQAFSANVEFVPTTTEALRRLATSPGGIYFASAPEVVPQCTIKPLPIGRQAGEFVPPYLEPFVPLSQCPGKRNQLNVQAFLSGKYPITRNLFVVIKQNNQTEQQAGEAYAKFLQTQQAQELIERAGFVRIR
ncbi:PstS family phosphate ABC transporter substrate-binding protein [Microseira wollei]|uniref:Periplasmic phosphate-binding protein of phosphate ABC transporter n=1 Tax=Microseira wollei NIES-4236 TaxID=2530354 RepID=A0AAV3XPB1_9CYAN|nr:PstS family phosphate ABC transporter substrate-binding protein [Microseira wollei]GET43551.1 periplasmic phosphate-binding protein of phosphate ABC transporter [Microseira wollei NIES-4236]